MPRHGERPFEEAIEDHLLTHGWVKGDPKDFDAGSGIDPGHALSFIQDSQPELWAELKKQHGDGLESTIIEWLIKALDAQGTLDLLRNGFKFFGKLIRLAYFRPTHGLNPDLVEKYGKNRLIVTRQVRFNPAGDESVDMVLLLNGLPIATAELKNPLTGQNFQHAIEQYRKRDSKLPLFQFKKRALVHFAVDPDLAFMTTRLRGEDTEFLPFNLGWNKGAGNPPVESGHRTAYLWQDVWERDSLLDIVARFANIETSERQIAGKLVRTETVIFPRYHQLDSVRRLEEAAREEGPGHNYLVQHSAGSGKSNSIAWLAYRLSELHKNDERVFHSVVVVTDRVVLDRQLQDTIFQFEHKLGVVARIDENSQQLADALTAGTPIIITTLQKFPYVVDKIGQLPNRNYAVIVDEAHSSQGGESASKLKEVLRARDLDDAAKQDSQDDEDAEDRLRRTMESRGPQKNLSFFAFTATPKSKTLEVFGRKDTEGKPQPFHVYSMRQAIEEGFILDVLKNYTTYKTYWKLLKKTAEDPNVPKRETAAQLARFVSLHPHNIAEKTEVMVEHFRHFVMPKLGGKAKAMVVTSSRLHAVRYKLAFEKYIAGKGYNIPVLVAFSGEVVDPDIKGSSFTEPGMNGGIRLTELPKGFASDEFRILIVANKYQTGFDQPLLHTMYVDKRLAGVQAVQTLSRLNRMYPGKEDTFVLDFVNDAAEIQQSFQPYYEQTTVSESADPQHLYELQHLLDSAQVYSQSEVDAFCKVFYAPKAKQTIADHAEMYKLLNPARDRFTALPEKAQDDFRTSLSAYIRLYAYLSQVIPFSDPDLEKLYTFARFLELRLPQDRKKAPLQLDGDVVLSYYRLQKISDGTINLETGAGGVVFGPTEAGKRRGSADEVKLSRVVEILNDRFGTNFTKADQLFFDSVVEEAKANDEVKQRASVNTFDNFAAGWFKQKISDAIVDRMDKNGEIATRYINDGEFQAVAFEALARRIYEELKEQGGGDPRAPTRPS